MANTFYQRLGNWFYIAITMVGIQYSKMIKSWFGNVKIQIKMFR